MNPQPSQSRPIPAFDVAEIVIRSTARLLDLQAAAAQALLQMQTRSAALLGGADPSKIFASDNVRQMSELYTASAEQGLNLIRQTNETLAHLQRDLSDAFARQTEQLTEQVRRSVQDIEQRTQHAVLQVREMSQQTSREAGEAAATPAAALQGSGAEERARVKRGA